MAEKGSPFRLRERLGLRSKKTKSDSSSRSTTPIPDPQPSLPGPSSALPPPQTSDPNPQIQTVSGSKPPVEPTRINRVPLPPLLKHPSTNPLILEVQKDLQTAIEELQTELLKYDDKHAKYAPLKEDDLVRAAARGSAGFGKVIEQVLSDRKARSKTFAGKVGAFMGSVYPIASVVLEIVSFSADAAGMLPLKITANALNTVVNQASTQHTRSEDIIGTLPDLEQYNTFFSDLQSLGYDQISDRLLETATRLFVAITNFLCASLKLIDTNIVKDTLMSIVKDNEAEAKSALTKAVTNLDAAVSYEIFFDEKRRAWRDECEIAMEFLSDIQALKEHDDIRNRRMKNSGNWILKNEDFLKWMNGDLKTLWCPGKPGAGKTVLCSTVIDHCRDKYRSSSAQQQFVGVAWVYCSYSNQNAQTMDRLMASIIKQLVASPSQQIGERLLRKVNDFGKKHKGGAPNLANYLNLLCDVTGSLEKSVVIIDALDECAEMDRKGYNREWLIEKLLGLSIQLLVTSRDLPVIQGLFNDAQSLAKICITPDMGDIESYIKWRIFDKEYGSPKKLRELIENDRPLLGDIISVVSKKIFSDVSFPVVFLEAVVYHHSSFNLARLQMDQISKLTSSGDVRKALTALPMKENDFYGKSITRIKANESRSKQALRILAWLLGAKAQVSVEAMRYAQVIVLGETSTEWEDFLSGEADLVDFCEGLVVILSRTRTVAFAHLTVNEFLKSAKKRVFDSDPDTVIGGACMTYLASDRAYREITTRYVRRFSLLLGVNFLSYSISHWREHILEENEEELVELIIRLFTQNILAIWDRTLWPQSQDFEDHFSLHTDGVWVASTFGLKHTVKRLIEMGAIWTDFETPSNPPAPSDLTSELFELLACYHADPSQNYYSRQPLLVAISKGDEAIARILLEAGANVNGTDQIGCTGLHLAATKPQSHHFLQILINRGANIEAQNSGGNTPLKMALMYPNASSSEVIAFLLRSGAKVDTEDGGSTTPLILALLIYILRRRKFKITQQDADEFFEFQVVKPVDPLVETGIDLNRLNKLGKTALHYA